MRSAKSLLQEAYSASCYVSLLVTFAGAKVTPLIFMREHENVYPSWEYFLEENILFSFAKQNSYVKSFTNRILRNR